MVTWTNKRTSVCLGDPCFPGWGLSWFTLICGLSTEGMGRRGLFCRCSRVYADLCLVMPLVGLLIGCHHSFSQTLLVTTETVLVRAETASVSPEIALVSPETVEVSAHTVGRKPSWMKSAPSLFIPASSLPYKAGIRSIISSPCYLNLTNVFFTLN